MLLLGIGGRQRVALRGQLVVPACNAKLRRTVAGTGAVGVLLLWPTDRARTWIAAALLTPAPAPCSAI